MTDNMVNHVPTVEYSSDNLAGYLDLCETFEPVVDACVSDLRASDAWSKNIVFGILFK